MGSKKLKRKKLKCKRLGKLYKLKESKPKRRIKHYKETGGVGDLVKNRTRKKLCSKKRYRSYFEEENKSDVKYFARVREDYFHHLQAVVNNNCKLFDSSLTDEVLENLALQLEQDALLACLQVKVYKRSMISIIEAIKKSTMEKQVHKDVQKLLSESFQEKTHEINKPISGANSTEVESFNKIPTIAFSRTEDNTDVDDIWRDEAIYSLEPYYLMTDHCEEAYSQGPNIYINDQSWCEDKASFMPNQTSNWSQSPPTSDLRISQNFNTSHSPISRDNYNDVLVGSDSQSYVPAQNEEKGEIIDPLSLSRNQLQKFVEQTLIETEKMNKQKRDEQERACIAHILEGDDSLDEKLNDSLSDNDNESKENIDESNLMDRLEKMRELFGMENEESQTEIIPELPKENQKVTQIPSRNRRPTIWKYEKYIQLHKYFIIAGEMTLERKHVNQKLFSELFGEDSDEENEVEFSSVEKYRSSCTERISSWVVKYLMPFYHNKRILGRNVFKSLGHYISDTIVDEIQYPDEWTVKYFVSKFFPPKKKYVCDADIINFQLE